MLFVDHRIGSPLASDERGKQGACTFSPLTEQHQSLNCRVFINRARHVFEPPIVGYLAWT